MLLGNIEEQMFKYVAATTQTFGAKFVNGVFSGVPNSSTRALVVFGAVAKVDEINSGNSEAAKRHVIVVKAVGLKNAEKTAEF